MERESRTRRSGVWLALGLLVSAHAETLAVDAAAARIAADCAQAPPMILTSGLGRASEEWLADALLAALPPAVTGATEACVVTVTRGRTPDALEVTWARRSTADLTRPGWWVLPAPTLVAAPRVPRIWALGDLHGDLEPALAILAHVGVVDAHGHWQGGQDILVQCGDINDRGADTVRIYRWLRQLEREATAAGGRVICLIGNHEAMGLLGDLRYLTLEEVAAYDRWQNVDLPEAPGDPLGLAEWRDAWASDGEIGAWVLSHRAIIKLGETIFAHGGLTPLREARETLDELDAALRARLTQRCAGAPFDPERDWLLTIQGPLWTRDPATCNESTYGASFDRLLDHHRAARMVVAHTPHPGITPRFDGRVIVIDTGMSAHYGGRPSVLEIEGDRVVAHALDGREIIEDR